MKKILLLLGIGCSLTAYGQEPLPYNCDFSNPAQNADWKQYRTGSLETPIYDWAIGGADPALFHDYPVGASGTDTTKDWFVSPAFDLSSGGELAFEYRVFAMMGNTPADQISVYLLEGSQNPDSATITLLADLTHFASSGTNWQDTTGIILPQTTGNASIAFYYQATNNWITVGIDSLYIFAEETGVATLSATHPAVDIYPNPAQQRLTIDGVAKATQVTIYDIAGGRQIRCKISGEQPVIDLSRLSPGIYFLRLTDPKNGWQVTQPFVKQ